MYVKYVTQPFAYRKHAIHRSHWLGTVLIVTSHPCANLLPGLRSTQYRLEERAVGLGK